MSEHLESFDLMLAAWNESDPSRIRQFLEQALSPSIRFVDPSIDVTGIDAFEANVLEVHSKIPGAVFSRTSEIDSQHEFHRYYWEIYHNSELFMPGFDVAETDESGQIVSVIGFFGPISKL